MTKYEPVVTKEEDIETAVSCPDQTPVAKKVEDVTHMERHRRKRPFLKGVFVGVVGTLLVLKLHMVIRHCHRHNHPGRHHDVDHPPFPPPPAFEIESFDFPEDFPDDYMMKGEEIKWDEKEMPMWDHEDMMNKKEMWHEKKMHGKKMWHEKKMQHKKMWHEKKMQHKKMWNDKKMDNHPKDKVSDIMKEPVVEIPVEEKELKATKEGLSEPKVEINEAAEQVVRKEESP
jgi:hypothetical protein